MSNRIVTLAFLVAGSHCYSQLPFRKNFVTAQGAIAGQVVEASDGGLVILGSTNSCGAGQHDILLVRTDINGDTIWVKTYGTSSDEYACNLVLTGDTGYMLVGIVGVPLQISTTALVISVDSVGDVLWSRSYETIGSVEDIVQSPDGSFVLTGVTPNQPPIFNRGTFLLKIDPSGSIVWTRSFAVPDRSLEPTDLSVMNDGGFLLSATVWDSVEEDWKALFIRTDQDGTMSWCRCFQSTNDLAYNKLTSGGGVGSPSGDCFISGAYYLEWAAYSCLFITKLEANGTPIWTRSYPSPILGANVHSGSALLRLSNGDLLASGASFSTSVGSIIIRTDSVGNDLYSYSYERLKKLTVRSALNENGLLSGEDFVDHAEIGFARADASGIIDCEQSPHTIAVVDSVLELFYDICKG